MISLFTLILVTIALIFAFEMTQKFSVHLTRSGACVLASMTLDEVGV